MEFQYYGANCVRITTKNASIVVDDNLAKLGLKSITKADDISLATHADVPKHAARFSADMPGEYEIGDVSIHGVAARALKDAPDKRSATIYTLSASELKIAVIGHIFPELTEDQLEQIGLADAVIVPVGGHDYTLDGLGALQVIKKIEPKLIIPTHYADKAIKYPVPQAELAEALKGLAMEAGEMVDKYRLKVGELPDTAQLVILTRQ